MTYPSHRTPAFVRRNPELPAFCRSRRPTVLVSISSLRSLRNLLLLVLLFQLSILLLVIVGPMPPRPPALSAATFIRPNAGTAAGGARFITPLPQQ